MDIGMWRLPGPTKFVQSVLQDLRSGKSAVLLLPFHSPAGLRESVEELVRDNELWMWQVLDSTAVRADNIGSLTMAIREKLRGPWTSAEKCSIEGLAEQIAGRVIWVNQVDEVAWPIWSKFLTRYQHACQSVAIADRGLFCVTRIGIAGSDPVTDVALSVRRWHGMVRRLDMTIYVDKVLTSRFTHPLHQKVALASIVEISGSDPDLALHMASQDLASILDPMNLLKEFAKRRNWTFDAVKNASWKDGMSDVVEGSQILHSAAVAMSEDRTELSRRIWRAQIGVIYPFIEEQRLRIIPQVRGYLHFPINMAFGIVNDAEDLEVGQLLYLLTGKPIRPRLRRLLVHLTAMRHALAHLEPVPLPSLFADEVIQPEAT